MCRSSRISETDGSTSGYSYNAFTTPSSSNARRCNGVGLEIFSSARPATLTWLRFRAKPELMCPGEFSAGSRFLGTVSLVSLQTADEHLWTGVHTLNAGNPFASLPFGEIVQGAPPFQIRLPLDAPETVHLPKFGVPLIECARFYSPACTDALQTSASRRIPSRICSGVALEKFKRMKRWPGVSEKKS